MKNIIFILISFLLFSCEKSNEEKAKEAVRNYLYENVDDFSTYESVKFGSLIVSNIDLNDTTTYSPEYQMFHSYRLKDEKGLKYLTKKYFKLNSSFEVIDSYFDPFAGVATPYSPVDTASAAPVDINTAVKLPLMPKNYKRN